METGTFCQLTKSQLNHICPSFFFFFSCWMQVQSGGLLLLLLGHDAKRHSPNRVKPSMNFSGWGPGRSNLWMSGELVQVSRKPYSLPSACSPFFSRQQTQAGFARRTVISHLFCSPFDDQRDLPACPCKWMGFARQSHFPPTYTRSRTISYRCGRLFTWQWTAAKSRPRSSFSFRFLLRGIADRFLYSPNPRLDAAHGHGGVPIRPPGTPRGHV